MLKQSPVCIAMGLLEVCRFISLKHFTAPYEVFSAGRITLMGLAMEKEAVLQPRLRLGTQLQEGHEHENISMEYLKKAVLFQNKILYKKIQTV